MNKNKDQQPPIEPTTSSEGAPVEEHHAVLDAIFSDLSVTEGGQAEAQAAASAALNDASAQSWAELPAMVGTLLAIVEPNLKGVYTPEACLNWGRCMVPVAQKYGWGDAPLGCEVPLIVSTFSLAAPSYLLLKAAIDSKKRQAAANPPAAIEQGQGGSKPADESSEPAPPWAVPA